MLYSKTVEQ